MQDDTLRFFVNLIILTFLFIPLYYSIKTRKNRQRLAIFLGCWAIYTVAPRLLVFWVPFWLVVWIMTLLLPRIRDERSREYVFALFILLILLPMVLWKVHADWFAMTLNRQLASIMVSMFPFMAKVDGGAGALAPVGLSFSVFRAIDLIINVHLDLIRKPRLRDVMHYGLFPPVLILGPIIQFQELQEDESKPVSGYSDNVPRGLGRIIVGFSKLFFLAYPLKSSQETVTLFYEQEGLTQGKLAVQVVLLALYFYLNFSAYSDIAIGMGRIYGFRIRENFHFPFFQPSPRQFWANWHMSLTSFAQRNLFIPLGGFRKKRQHLAILVTMMFIALWHGLTLPIVLFGLLHGMTLVLLRIVDAKPPPKEPQRITARILSTLATFCFMSVTIPLLLMSGEHLLSFYGLLFFGVSR